MFVLNSERPNPWVQFGRTWPCSAEPNQTIFLLEPNFGQTEPKPKNRTLNFFLPTHEQRAMPDSPASFKLNDSLVYIWHIVDMLEICIFHFWINYKREDSLVHGTLHRTTCHCINFGRSEILVKLVPRLNSLVTVPGIELCCTVTVGGSRDISLKISRELKFFKYFMQNTYNKYFWRI